MINDDKSVYIREDLAYNLICYSNLGLIKGDKIRKNIGISNNQSIRRERKIIAKVIKIIAAKSMARQYKTEGLSFEVDLCFLVHRIVVEIDEDGHLLYDEKKSNKIKENLGFIFINFNIDVEDFDLDVEISRIYNYIKKSSVKLAINVAD